MKHFFNRSILLIPAIILALFIAGCGGGWRMPTMDELRTLYTKKGPVPEI